MSTSYWANTPGGYYAVAYILAAAVMVLCSPRKKSIPKSLLICAGNGIVLFLLMTVTHGLSSWFFVPLMMSFFGIVWVTIHATCRYDAGTSFYIAARAFIIGEFIASLEWQIFYYLVERMAFPTKVWAQSLLCLLVDGVMIAIFYYLERRNAKINENLQMSMREILSAIIITLAIFTVSNVNYMFSSANLSELVLTQLFLVRTLIDLGGVAILYAYHAQLGELTTRYEMERLQNMLEMQRGNYEMLEQSVNTINQKYHDLKYQIAVLKSEASAKDTLNYLDRMEQEIKAYEAQNKTGNKVLDTILTGKSLYCQNHWIELTSVADGHALDFMDPMDISSMFGNMLDNAIESVEKIEQKERRLIHVAVTKQKGFLRIRVENCCDIEPEFKDGVPQTTKKDKKYHGFGLRSIKNTAKKYGGSTTFHVQNGWFEVRILIPIPKTRAEG